MRKRWLLSTAAAAAAAIALSTAADLLRRRRQLRRGEIRKLRGAYANIDGNRMFTRHSVISPYAPDVVLVHGFGISSSYFVQLAERLATRCNVYAPDLPGHGRSETPHEAMNIPAFADTLVAWMDQAGLGRVTLVGNSMGCQVVADAAARYPDRVSGVVLIGPTIDPRARSVWRQLARLIMSGFFEKPSLIPLIVKDYLRMGRRLIPELRFMLSDRVEDKLVRIKKPVVIIRGENDAIVPQRWFSRAGELAGADTAVVVPRAGHAVHHSAAATVEKAIVALLGA